MKKPKTTDKTIVKLAKSYEDNFKLYTGESTYMRQKREKRITKRWRIVKTIAYTLFFLALVVNYILLYKVFARVNLFVPHSELKKQLLTINQARHAPGSYCANCYNK